MRHLPPKRRPDRRDEFRRADRRLCPHRCRSAAAGATAPAAPSRGYGRRLSATGEYPSHGREGTWINKWQSHGIKLPAMEVAAIDDDALIGTVHDRFVARLNANLRPDGTVYDFSERDALYDAGYDLYPLVRASLAAAGRGQDWFGLAGAGICRPMETAKRREPVSVGQPAGPALSRHRDDHRPGSAALAMDDSLYAVEVIPAVISRDRRQAAHRTRSRPTGYGTGNPRENRPPT